MFRYILGRILDHFYPITVSIGDYTGECCIMCDRVRVYNHDGKLLVCDKCNWIQNRGRYLTEQEEYPL